MTVTPCPKIAIIGAGPSDLTLARILQRNGIPVTIFELDTNADNRDQGGSLDLHPTTGQAALLAAGLMQEFRKFARPEGDTNKVVRYDGTILFDDNNLDKNTTSQAKSENEREEESEEFIEGRPEIDRGKLRAILLDSIEPGTIQWVKILVKIESNGNAQYDLYFADGAVETGFDLVVGADGAWSKVRPLLTDVKPFYSGVTGIELWVLDVNDTNPWLSKYVGNGSLFIFDQDRAVLLQRNGSIDVKDPLRILACVRQAEDWSETCGIDWKNPGVAKERLVEEYFGNCGADIKRAIKEAGDHFWARKFYMLPVGLEWPGRKGLTLMGDAAHLMTPFAGVGVNVAMTDAKDLAEKIISWWKSKGENEEENEGLDAAVREYEKEMFVRAKENAEQTKKGLEGHFSENGAEEIANRMRGHQARRQANRQAHQR